MRCFFFSSSCLTVHLINHIKPCIWFFNCYLIYITKRKKIMKIKMQVQRITVEYSQILEVEVPSNDELEAQFIVEEMLAQGKVNFSTRELTEEVDHAEYYLADLEESDDPHFTEVVQVININVNQRDKNLIEIADFTDFPHGDYDKTSKHDVADFLKFCIEDEYRRHAHLLDHKKIVIINEE